MRHRLTLILILSPVLARCFWSVTRRLCFGISSSRIAMPANIITGSTNAFRLRGTRGRWPLWEPEENAGMPLLGNPTAAVFYPGKVVFAVLPYAWAARTYILAHSALAFLSMLVLMRSWGTSWIGSAMSAMAYAFGGPILFQYSNIIYLIGAAWLPLGVHAVDRWVRLGRRWGLVRARDCLVDADTGGRAAGCLPLGSGEHRLRGGSGLEPSTDRAKKSLLVPGDALLRPGRLCRSRREHWSSGAWCASLPATVAAHAAKTQPSRVRPFPGRPGCHRV